MISENTKRVGFILISLIVAFLLIEGLLRLGSWGFYYLQDEQNKKIISLNRKELVVLCIGESTTGMGGKNSWPSQLQRILNNTQHQMTFHIINKGLPGTDTNEILKQLPFYIMEYKPAIVLAMVGINDGYEGRPGDLNYDIFYPSESLINNSSSRQSWFITLLSHSRVYGLFYWMTDGIKYLTKQKNDVKTKIHLTEKLINERESFDYGLRNPNTTHLLPRTILNLNNMANLTTAKSIKFIFVQYALRRVDILKNSVKGNGLYISNYEIFYDLQKKYNYDDLFIDKFANDFGHATPFGNRIIAENVARQLKKILGFQNQTP